MGCVAARSTSLLALALLASASSAAFALPVPGTRTAAEAEADQRLRGALARCGPGDSLARCVEALRVARTDVEVDGTRAVVALKGAFYAVTFDARDGERIVDVAFRATALPDDVRADIARYVEEHAGAYPFSEPCQAGAQFCGVFWPKQKGGAAAIEIGVGLLAVSGAPVWRSPPKVPDVYRKADKLLDIARTPADGLVVQFSLPLGKDGQPARQPPLLRHAYDTFAQAPFLRSPVTEQATTP